MTSSESRGAGAGDPGSARCAADEYEALAPIYDRWSAADPAAGPSTRFYTDLCRDAEEPVVELGVGNGRIAVEIARLGKRVVGVDSSEAMLRRCRQRANRAGVGDRIQCLLADVREFELEAPAPLILFPFRSIGHLCTQPGRIHLARHLRSQLVPGGRFIFDHYVFDKEWARAHDGIPRLMCSWVSDDGSRHVVWDTYRYLFKEQRMECLITVETCDESGVVRDRTHHPLTFSWILEEQVLEMAGAADLRVEAVHGDFHFGAFNEGSQEQVWILRRGP